MSAAAFAPARLADSLLRSVGGRAVLLRLPAPAVAGDLGEQLGLAQPGFQDSVLAPVVFRKIRASITPDAIKYELLVSASAVRAITGQLGSFSAGVLFAQALGVVIDDSLFTITAVASAEAFGQVYLYRLALQGAAAMRL